MRVVCVGKSKYDITCFTNEFPLEGTKNNFTEKSESSSGSAAIVATLLAKWNVETYLKTALGNDFYGDVLKKEFENNSIKTTYIETNYDKKTSLTFSLINKKNNNKTEYNIVAHDNLPRVKKLDDIDVDFKVMYTDGYEYHATNSMYNRFEGKTKVIGLEEYDAETLDLCKLSDYLIFTKDVAEKLSNLKTDVNNGVTILNMYNALISRFPNKEIIIIYEDFGVVYKKDNQVKIVPGLKESKKMDANPNIFIGSFVYGLVSNYEFEQNVTIATIALGLSMLSTEGKLTFPNLSNVINYYNAQRGASEPK